jgi:hypothetical protein
MKNHRERWKDQSTYSKGQVEGTFDSETKTTGGAKSGTNDDEYDFLCEDVCDEEGRGSRN